MTVGRRELLKAGAAAAAVAALSRPARPRAQGKGKVRLAYLQLGWAATEIIHKEDLLGKRGWQAEYSIVPGAPGPVLDQLASKNVDAIDMSFALAAKAFEDGVPLKVTGVATAVLGAIVARKDAGLARVEDLRGRKIGAVVGTSTFFDIRALTLKGYGLDLQKDTQIVTATAPPDMVTICVSFWRSSPYPFSVSALISKNVDVPTTAAIFLPLRSSTLARPASLRATMAPSTAVATPVTLSGTPSSNALAASAKDMSIASTFFEASWFSNGPGAPGTMEYSACQPRLPSRSSLWMISVAAQPSWR